MTQKEIRLLRADEIECRVGMVSEKGLSLLLYKDARADMKILDETYGSTGWQRIHELIGGNLYCRVQIWDEEKQCWVSKMDVGTESYTEKEKGQASDSFKRACVSVGIGRLPFFGFLQHTALFRRKMISTYPMIDLQFGKFLITTIGKSQGLSL